MKWQTVGCWAAGKRSDAPRLLCSVNNWTETTADIVLKGGKACHTLITYCEDTAENLQHRSALAQPMPNVPPAEQTVLPECTLLDELYDDILSDSQNTFSPLFIQLNKSYVVESTGVNDRLARWIYIGLSYKIYRLHGFAHLFESDALQTIVLLRCLESHLIFTQCIGCRERVTGPGSVGASDAG